MFIFNSTTTHSFPFSPILFFQNIFNVILNLFIFSSHFMCIKWSEHNCMYMHVRVRYSLHEFTRKAYLSRRFNVVLVDWKKLTHYPCYFSALGNTKLVAQCTAQVRKFFALKFQLWKKVRCNIIVLMINTWFVSCFSWTFTNECESKPSFIYFYFHG